MFTTKKTERVHDISNENSEINILTRVIENSNISVRQTSKEDITQSDKYNYKKIINFNPIAFLIIRP